MNSHEELKQWLSSLDPALHEATYGQTDDYLAKLECLMKIGNQADKELDEVISSIQQCKEEYGALGYKLNKHLLLLGLDSDNLSGCFKKTVQTSEGIIQSGLVGDGTSAGALLQQTADALESAAAARKEMSMKNDIWFMSRKNAKLTERVRFFEREARAASEEVRELGQKVIDGTSVSHCKLKFSEVEQLSKDVKSELDKLRESSSFGEYEYLLARHEEIGIIQRHIVDLEKKLDQFGDLPTSIPEAIEVLEKTKKEESDVSQLFKQKLTQSRGVRF